MEQDPYRPSETTTVAGAHNKKSGFMKALKIILIVFGSLMLLIIALLIWAGVKTGTLYSEFDGKAEPFANQFLTTQNPWSYTQAKPHLSKLWLESVAEDESIQLFEYFNNLGSLTSIGELSWEGCSAFAYAGVGSVNRCDYLILAKYEEGDAQVRMGLVLEGEAPKIIQLRVNSNAFLK